ncbi:MAG TPA: hypothetical protein V6D48_21640 [Oculatellaceae cyanobacterium]
MRKLLGTTPDISVLLQFDWYEPVYFKVEESNFPSMSNEKLGCLVGISEHVGHALTYLVLTEDTQKILHRSVVHTATDPASINKRANGSYTDEPHPYIQSHLDDVPSALDGEEHGKSKNIMPIISPDELVGKTFGIMQEDGHMSKIKIIEAIQDHQESTDDSSIKMKFRCSINDDEYEEIITYNQIMKYPDKDNGDPTFWKFNWIIAHHGPLNKSHKRLQGINIQCNCGVGE